MSHNANILFIDGNIEYVNSLAVSLQDIYKLVKGATSLDEADKYLRETEFDVIVFNTEINGRGGLETLAFLSAYGSHPSIIAYSDSPNVSGVIEILKNGGFDFLVSPFDFNRLMESIDKGIENRKSFLEIISLNKSLIENQDSLEHEKEDLKNRNKELQTLTSITKVMTGSVDLNEILHEIIQGIYNVLLFDRIFVSLIDTERGVEEAKVAMGLQDSVYDETINELSWETSNIRDNPWMDGLLRGKKIVKVENPLENEQYMNSRIVKYHPTTFVKVPLIAKGNVVGSLTIDNIKSMRPITDEDMDALWVFADYAGIAIEKAKLYENLQKTNTQLKDMQKKSIENERLIAINEVAVSVNHEINNPLCSISLSIEMLKKELGEGSEQVMKKLQMIEKDIDRIKDITSQLAKIQSVKTTEYAPEVKMIDIRRSTYLEEE